MNQFLQAVRQHDTYTENGAVSHSTTGNSLLDYFSKAGSYRDRDFNDVSADMSKIWAESPLIALQMVYYGRMVTRKTTGSTFVTEEVQKGQGNRSEFRQAIRWIATYHPETFYKNMYLIPVVGCWKDLWHAEVLPYIDQDKLVRLIVANIDCPYNRPLLAKYLPRIKSRSNVRNDRHKALNSLARSVCSRMGWTERDYRKFKTEGNHAFQTDICQGNWDKLNFSTIPGKALFNIAVKRGKDGQTMLQRHNAEAGYIKWLEKQPVAKFTGYPYELVKQIPRGYYSSSLSRAEKMTIDKQFDGLIELAKQDRGGITGNVWCAMDTSGSMSMRISAKSDISAFDVCVGLGVYFAELNEGAFHNHVIMFDNNSTVQKLSGTFSERVQQLPMSAMGGTNFQSVIDEIVRIRKTRPEVPIEDYPQTLLVVSDMQFNHTGSMWGRSVSSQREIDTNYEKAMRKLRAVGLPNIRVIWWQVNGGRTTDFPSLDSDNCVMLSGFDGAVITTILGGNEIIDEKTGEKRQPNAYESMLLALDQEVLNKLRV